MVLRSRVFTQALPPRTQVGIIHASNRALHLARLTVPDRLAEAVSRPRGPMQAAAPRAGRLAAANTNGRAAAGLRRPPAAAAVTAFRRARRARCAAAPAPGGGSGGGGDRPVKGAIFDVDGGERAGLAAAQLHEQRGLAAASARRSIRSPLAAPCHPDPQPRSPVQQRAPLPRVSGCAWGHPAVCAGHTCSAALAPRYLKLARAAPPGPPPR